MIVTVILAMAVGYVASRFFADRPQGNQAWAPMPSSSSAGAAAAAGSADNDENEERWEVVRNKAPVRSVSTQSQCTYVRKGQHNQELMRPRFSYLHESQQGAWPEHVVCD